MKRQEMRSRTFIRATSAPRASQDQDGTAQPSANPSAATLTEGLLVDQKQLETMQQWRSGMDAPSPAVLKAIETLSSVKSPALVTMTLPQRKCVRTARQVNWNQNPNDIPNLHLNSHPNPHSSCDSVSCPLSPPQFHITMLPLASPNPELSFDNATPS